MIIGKQISVGDGPDNRIGFTKGAAGGALTVGGHRLAHRRLRFPVAGPRPRHDPDTAAGREQRQMRVEHPADRVTRLAVHRAGQRMAECDEA